MRRDNWEKEILIYSKRLNESDYDHFVNLVDEIDGSCDLETARVLMKTFSSKPDHGTQERVISVLASADKSVFVQVIIEELPRLYDEAYEWAESLVGLEIEKRPSLFLEVVRSMGNKSIPKLLDLIKRNDFIEFYDNARFVSKELEKI